MRTANPKNYLERWFNKPVLILPRKDEGLTTSGKATFRPLP